jgi:hypothetical protein
LRWRSIMFTSRTSSWLSRDAAAAPASSYLSGEPISH